MKTDDIHPTTALRSRLNVSAEALRAEGASARLGLPTIAPFKLGDAVLVVVRDAHDDVIGQVEMVVVGRRVARPGKRSSAGVVVSPLDARARSEMERLRLRLLAPAPRSEPARFDSVAEAVAELRAVATGGVGLFPIESVVPAKSLLALAVACPGCPAAPPFLFTAEAAFFVDSDKKRFVAVRAASELERLRVEGHVRQIEQERVSV